MKKPNWKVDPSLKLNESGKTKFKEFAHKQISLGISKFLEIDSIKKAIANGTVNPNFTAIKLVPPLGDYAEIETTLDTLQIAIDYDIGLCLVPSQFKVYFDTNHLSNDQYIDARAEVHAGLVPLVDSESTDSGTWKTRLFYTIQDSEALAGDLRLLLQTQLILDKTDVYLI